MDVLGVGWQFYLSLFGLMVCIPSLASIILYLIQPTWLKPLLWSALAFTSIFLWSAWWVSENQLQFHGNSLSVRAGFYQTTLHDVSFAESQVSVVGQAELGILKPAMVVNGINLPQYQVGWYRLANSELAFVMLIGNHAEVSVVKTPTMTLLISGDILRSQMMAVL